MRIFSRNKKIWALAVVVAIVVVMLLPTTMAQAQTRLNGSQYHLSKEFTLSEERELEKFYWEIILSQIHIDSKYYRGVDGHRWRDEVQISAEIILDEMLCFPGGEPGDMRAIHRQRHWGNFFWRIARGNFSTKELRRNLHRVRRKARQNGIPLW